MSGAKRVDCLISVSIRDLDLIAGIHERGNIKFKDKDEMVQNAFDAGMIELREKLSRHGKEKNNDR